MMGRGYRRRGIGTAVMLLTVVVLTVALGIVTYYLMAPRVEDAVRQNQWEGIDVLEKYRENADMVGWLQVEGTCINYPVMRGESYLRRDFSGNRSQSGSLFVEDDWDEDDMCTLIYGHNMWMYGTMLNPLHEFTDSGFFGRHRKIKLYVVDEDGLDAEKRTYEIICCVRTRVDQWNYASCQYIFGDDELSGFLEECMDKAVNKRETAAFWEEAVVLSTCSYHVKGGVGRLLLVGGLVKRESQTRLDPMLSDKT